MNDSKVPAALIAAKQMSDHNRAEMREIFDRTIKLAERDRLHLRVSREVKPGGINNQRKRTDRA